MSSKGGDPWFAVMALSNELLLQIVAEVSILS
jgi:hypothetical protein